jgi:hypothetical protein
MPWGRRPHRPQGAWTAPAAERRAPRGDREDDRKLEWDDAARASGLAKQWEKLFAASAN